MTGPAPFPPSPPPRVRLPCAYGSPVHHQGRSGASSSMNSSSPIPSDHGVGAGVSDAGAAAGGVPHLLRPLPDHRVVHPLRPPRGAADHPRVRRPAERGPAAAHALARPHPSRGGARRCRPRRRALRHWQRRRTLPEHAQLARDAGEAGHGQARQAQPQRRFVSSPRAGDGVGGVGCLTSESRKSAESGVARDARYADESTR